MNDDSIRAEAESNSIASLVTVFCRHIKKAIFIPLSIVLVAVLVILLAPRTYRSEAKLFVQLGRQSVKLDPTATTGDTISLQASNRSAEVAPVLDMLVSRGVIEKVVEHLGPDVVLGRTGPGATEGNPVASLIKGAVGSVLSLLKSIDPVSDFERAVVQISKNLQVDAERESTLVSVAYDAETPELAQLVAQTLVDIYRQEHLRLHRTTGSKEFFTEQHEELRKLLDEAVSELRSAKNRMNIVSIEARRNTLENRLGAVENNLLDNRRLLASADARIGDLKKQIAAIPERIVAEQTTVPNTGTDQLRAQLYALQVLLLDQEAKYNDDHPQLQATRQQLREAQEMLELETKNRQQTTSAVNPNYRELSLQLAQAETELAGLNAHQERLTSQRAQVLTELKQLNNWELEIDQLERKAQLARNNYFHYAENLETARINDELDKERISNVVVAQDAALAEKPISPSKVLVGVFSLIFAFSATVCCVFLAERMNTDIYTEQHLRQAVPIPVLGVIPEGQRYAKSIV